MRLALASIVIAATQVFGDGIPAKDVKMKNVDGKQVSIADVAGKDGTLVIFSCNHCPFVKAWEQRIAEIGNTYRTKGVGVIQINSNDPAVQAPDGYAEMQTRAKEREFQFPYVVDEKAAVAVAFGASRTPEVYLFDRAGKLVYHGAVDDNKDATKASQHFLKDALDAVLAGKPVAVAETKAVGCTIKFPKT